MKTLCLSCLLLCSAVLAMAEFPDQKGESFSVALPPGFKVDNANPGQYSEKSGDVLVEHATNDKQQEIAVYYASKMPVSDADVPRFVDMMRGFFAKKLNGKVVDSKVEKHNGHNWGVVELAISAKQGEVRKIILIYSLDGSPVRIELDSPPADVEALRAAAQKTMEQTAATANR